LAFIDIIRRQSKRSSLVFLLEWLDVTKGSMLKTEQQA
jgi:hypothetical protein